MTFRGKAPVTKPEAIIRLIRPQQWIKNVIVLLPVVFARRAGDVGAWIHAGWAAGAFCLAASAVYIINDLRDRRADRLHPRKKNRPLASGAIAPGQAVGLAALLAIGSLAAAAALSTMVAGLIVAYLVLQAAYTFGLKRKILLDVIIIAGGFVLRAGAGAVAIGAEPSPWLIVCTFTLCMFMGFCKRRGELNTLGDVDLASGHRHTLIGYTPELLTHLITMSAAIAVLSFVQYAVHPDTVGRFGTIYLVYTLPAVVYAVFRFAMLSMQGRYDDPTDLILGDRPFQLTLLMWAAAAMAIIVWGPSVQDYLRGAP